MCSHTCLRGQACHPLTQTRWEIGLGAFLSQAFSIIGRGWWIGEMGCSITAYLRSPAAWYMWVVLSHWCLGPLHPQRLWTQRSQTFQPPLLTLPILHPHQDSFSSQNNLDPTGHISKIPSLPPNLSFSFFLCYSHLSIPANGTPIIPHQSRLLSFGKVPWSYWLRWAFTATTQLFNCDYFPTSSFILPVSQSPQNWVLYII